MVENQRTYTFFLGSVFLDPVALCARPLPVKTNIYLSWDRLFWTFGKSGGPGAPPHRINNQMRWVSDFDPCKMSDFIGF